MSLVDDIDRAAAELDANPDQSYEVAIDIALAADRWAREPSPGASAAAGIRDAFGTWVEHIHSNVGDPDALAAAEDAHREIAAAVLDWTQSGRHDIDLFAAHCTARLDRVDIAWMEADPRILARRSRVGKVLDRLRGKRP